MRLPVLSRDTILTAVGLLSEELGKRGVLAGDFAPIATLDLPFLRVQAPTPEYMLAMKVLASRAAVSAERGDARDIAFLIKLLGITESGEVMEIVGRYYDPSRILPQSLYLVDEILEEMGK